MYNIALSDSALSLLVSNAAYRGRISGHIIRHPIVKKNSKYYHHYLPNQDWFGALDEVKINKKPYRIPPELANEIAPQRSGRGNPEVRTRPRDREIEMFNEIATRGRETGIFDEIATARRPGKKMAVIREEKNGLVYIEENGNSHNITVSGKWTYPVLIEVIPSVKMNGKSSANIVICKRQIAKRLVYPRLNRLIEVFNRYALDSDNFQILNSKNKNSYVNVVTEKFYEEVYILNKNGNNIQIDNEESLETYKTLSRKLSRSENPYIVTYTRKSIVRDGKIFCWPMYSLLSLQDAKRLVYLDKNNKNSLKSIKSNPTVTDSGSFRIGAAYPTKRKIVENELTVERVDDRPYNNYGLGVDFVIDGWHNANNSQSREETLAEYRNGVEIEAQNANDHHRGEPVEHRVLDDAHEVAIRQNDERLTREAQNIDAPLLQEGWHINHLHEELPIQDEVRLAREDVQAVRGIHTTIEDQDEEERPEEVQVRGEEEVQVMTREDVHRENIQAIREEQHRRRIQEGQDGEEERPEEVQVRGEDRIIEDDF